MTHTSQSFKIDAEFRDLIPTLKSYEYDGLKKSVLEEGCRDPLIVWGDIIVDGHNRYEICQKHNLSFSAVKKEFADRTDAKIWIILNQLSRRNLSDFERSEMALELEPLIREKAAENKKAGQLAGRTKPQHIAVSKKDTTIGSVCQNSDKTKNEKSIDTKKELAKAAGVSHDTIEKVKKIKSQCAPELEQAITDKKVSIHVAATLSELPADEQKKIISLPKKEIIQKAKELRGETKPANPKETDAPEHILKSLKASIDIVLTYTKGDPVFTEKLQNLLLTNLSTLKKLTSFLPPDIKAEYGMALLKEVSETFKSGVKPDELLAGTFRKVKRICSNVEKISASNNSSSQADTRVKELTDWYYQLWDNNPPEKVNGNGGGRIAKIFSDLLDILEEKKIADPPDYIKNLYAFYKNTSPGLLGKKENQWLFGDSVKSLIKFRAKFADIEVCYLKRGGGHIGNQSSAGIAGAEEGQTVKTGAFGFPQHILDRNKKSSGTQAQKA